MKDKLIEGFRLTLKYTIITISFPFWGPVYFMVWFFGDQYTEGALTRFVNWMMQ
jgi:hypothetical protein